jgi:integrase/recombinase XerC
MNTTAFLNQQQAFLEHYRGLGKSENSLKCYRLDFNCINDFLKESKVQNQHTLNFDQHLTKSFEQFLFKKYPNINSVRRKLQTIRLFFDYLVSCNIIAQNPIKQIQSSPKVLYPPTLHPMEEINQVQLYLVYKIKHSASSKEVIQNFRNYILFLIIYHAGLSVSQLANLKIDHFLELNNFDNDDFRILITNTKRQEPYTVPLPAYLKKTFALYFKLLQEEMRKDNYFFDQVFFNSNAYKIISGGISARGLEDIFHKISESLKITITPKSLRQTAALHWLSSGHSTATVKEWLGVAPAYNISLYSLVLEQKADMCKNLTPLPDLEFHPPTF